MGRWDPQVLGMAVGASESLGYVFVRRNLAGMLGIQLPGDAVHLARCLFYEDDQRARRVTECFRRCNAHPCALCGKVWLQPLSHTRPCLPVPRENSGTKSARLPTATHHHAITTGRPACRARYDKQIRWPLTRGDGRTAEMREEPGIRESSTAWSKSAAASLRSTQPGDGRVAGRQGRVHPMLALALLVVVLSRSAGEKE